MKVLKCACGCGENTKAAKDSDPRRNAIKGQPNRFIHGHNGRCKNGRKDIVGANGYNYAHIPNHPRVLSNGYVSKALLVIEKALGKNIPPKAVIHHFDEDKLNDENNNLVLCEDAAYHKLLHMRQKAYISCGHVGWRKCWTCKEWDKTENLYFPKGRNAGYHRGCVSIYSKKYRESKRQTSNKGGYSL